MIYDYYGYYQSPMTQFMDMGFFLAGAAVLAIVAGVVLFATFMNKKHEGKHQGFWQRVYNFLNFNRFYAENILRFLYIIIVCVLVFVGIALMILAADAGYAGFFWMGAGLLVLGNLAARICFELLMMLIIFCRKTVSIDRRLSRLEDIFTVDTDEETESESKAASRAQNEPEAGAEAMSGADLCGMPRETSRNAAPEPSSAACGHEAEAAPEQQDETAAAARETEPSTDTLGE